MQERMDALIDELNIKVRTSHSIEIDEIERRELVKYLHGLEQQFISLTPCFDKLLKRVFDETSAYMRGKDVSIRKIVQLSNNELREYKEAEKSDPTLNSPKKDVIEFHKSCIELYEQKSSNELLNKIKENFKKICWSKEIRWFIYSDLTSILSAWNIMRKRLNRLLKEKAKGRRVSKYEFETFLINKDFYPLSKEEKTELISKIQPEIDIFEQVLGVNFFEQFTEIAKMTKIYSKYTIGKNAVLLSVKRYMASVCRQSGIKSPEEVDEVVNKSIANLSEILFRYQTEKDFIPFVHQWVQRALSTHRTSQRIVRAPLQIEQKRPLITKAYDLFKREHPISHINYKKIALIGNELSPQSHLTAEEVEICMCAETNIFSSYESSEDQEVPNTHMYGEIELHQTPEKTLLSKERIGALQKSISELDIIDNRIMILKERKFKIEDIAKLSNLSYDQTRRRIEICKNSLKEFNTDSDN